jgi:hypothetical protein
MKKIIFSLLSVAVLIAMGLAAVSPPPVAAADTGWHSPSANAADTGGDGDGFETHPTRAYADGAPGFADNENGAGDRHLYYNYGLSIPAGSTINGIEVRLDWWLQRTDGTNTMEVELSWDGGAT